jgi:hypothetical protein
VTGADGQGTVAAVGAGGVAGGVAGDWANAAAATIKHDAAARTLKRMDDCMSHSTTTQRNLVPVSQHFC